MAVKKTKKSLTATLVSLFLVVFFCAVGANLYHQILAYRQLEKEQALLAAQIDEERQKLIELKEQQDYYMSDAFIEKMAREQLGLIKPDERIFINRAQ